MKRLPKSWIPASLCGFCAALLLTWMTRPNENPAKQQAVQETPRPKIPTPIPPAETPEAETADYKRLYAEVRDATQNKDSARVSKLFDEAHSKGYTSITFELHDQGWTKHLDDLDNAQLRQNVDGYLAKVAEIGLITKFDLPRREVQVDSFYWEAASLDDKKFAVDMCRKRVELSGKLGVTLIDNKSGKKLGQYSTWSGITIFP